MGWLAGCTRPTRWRGLVLCEGKEWGWKRKKGEGLGERGQATEGHGSPKSQNKILTCERLQRVKAATVEGSLLLRGRMFRLWFQLGL